MLFPEDKSSIAKQFWQHTGFGVSSRFATRILAVAASPPPSPTRLKPMAHHHYAPKTSRYPFNDAQPLEEDRSVYLEQRYGRNLDVAAAKCQMGETCAAPTHCRCARA